MALSLTVIARFSPTLPIAALFTLSIGALLLLVHPTPAHAKARRPKTDCNVRLPRHQDPKWTCAKASQWMSLPEQCIPAHAFQKWGCLDVDVDARFCATPAAATFNLTAWMGTSGVTLDCNQQTISHANPAGELTAQESAIRFPYQKSVNQITVKNCKIQNTARYGVDLKRIFRGSELADPATMRGHEQITLKNLQLKDLAGIGIYVGQNSAYTTLKNVSIARAYMGVYLEAGSHHSHLDHVQIRDTHTREGLAVDSSSHNVIEHSAFRDNATGTAIRFYKNCGEESGQVCPIVRSMDAGNNLIRHNVFLKNDVSVAYRQGKLYIGGWCESLTRPLSRWRDRAPDNHFEHNVFTQSQLEIKDGPITLIENTFKDESSAKIGARGPLGNGPIPISGLLKKNYFERHSRLIFKGPKRAFDDLLIQKE